MKTIRLNVSVPMVWFTFESQAAQYEPSGPPGISYFEGVTGDEVYGNVDCLLYRDGDGAVIGILNHFPKGSAYDDAAGDFLVFVSPDHRRKGIGTALLTEADARWHLDFEQQKYTEEGAATIAAYLRTKVQ